MTDTEECPHSPYLRPDECDICKHGLKPNPREKADGRSWTEPDDELIVAAFLLYDGRVPAGVRDALAEAVGRDHVGLRLLDAKRALAQATSGYATQTRRAAERLRHADRTVWARIVADRIGEAGR